MPGFCQICYESIFSTAGLIYSCSDCLIYGTLKDENGQRKLICNQCLTGWILQQMDEQRLKELDQVIVRCPFAPPTQEDGVQK